jgi:hypothetical protein
MLVIYLLSERPTGPPFVWLTLICTAGVLISNLVVAVRYHHYPRQAVTASLVAAALLLVAADQFSPLPFGIMSHYGFGKNHKVNLLLNDQGAAIIEKLGLQNKCAVAFRENLCEVEILSKLGGEYCLRLDGRIFTLPKSAVISLIQSGNDGVTANVAFPDSDRIASRK